MDPHDHNVTSVEELEALYGTPSTHAVKKESPTVNDAYRRLIEAAPFVSVASVGPEGVDCSPRGDRPGFVRVLDERTLAMPDRRGNKRLDTLRNVVRDGRVALLFLIPGVNEALRVNGRGRVTTEPALLESFSVDGAAPTTVLVIEIDTLYFQCARALKRSALWSDASRVDRDSLPSAGELLRSVVTDFDAEAYDAALEARQKRTLY